MRRNRKRNRNNASPPILESTTFKSHRALDKDNLFCAECGKKIYTMKFEAEYVRQERMHSDEVKHLKIYACPHDKGYHLTSGS